MASAVSFRDPSGFVFERDGVVYRQVNACFRDDYDALMTSGLYEALVEAGWLVPHIEVDPGMAAGPGAYRVLRPERVPFVAYPYEWCFGQLKAAARTTLAIQDLALDHGMSLKDASAFNIQFRDGRPLLIDTLSFERLSEGAPWVAYRQFCEHFLGPLALGAYRDVRLTRLSQVCSDGVPIDLVSRLLPRRTWARFGLLTHVHLHAASQRRYARRSPSEHHRDSAFSLRAFRGLIDSLRSTVTRLSHTPTRSAWSSYYDETTSYTPTALATKERLVAEFLDEVAPQHVFDAGANTGRFSRLAAERGAQVVALDADEPSVEALWATLQNDPCPLLPLVVDLRNPSPGSGWAGHERLSLADRGPADLVLALALVHHLAISGNIPLTHLADYLAALGRWLVVEFVPKSDPMVSILLARRRDVFAEYTLDAFESAFAAHFEIERREPVEDSQRTLYLMRRRHNVQPRTGTWRS